MSFVTTPERIGRRDGLREGRLEGIEAVLEVRFGGAGLRLIPEIREIRDPEKLEAVLRAVRTVASPEKLRQVWNP